MTTRSNCSIENKRKHEDDESLDIRPTILKKYLITPPVKKKKMRTELPKEKTVNKIFKCDSCEKLFRDNYNLKRHINKHCHK